MHESLHIAWYWRWNSVMSLDFQWVSNLSIDKINVFKTTQLIKYRSCYIPQLHNAWGTCTYAKRDTKILIIHNQILQYRMCETKHNKLLKYRRWKSSPLWTEQLNTEWLIQYLVYTIYNTGYTALPRTPTYSVVTGFWLILHWQPQFPQCLVVFEAVNELANPLFPNWVIT